MENLAVKGDGGEGGGYLSLWVRQLMSLVLGTENETSRSETFLEMFMKRFCRRLMFDLCDGDATVRAKLS